MKDLYNSGLEKIREALRNASPDEGEKMLMNMARFVANADKSDYIYNPVVAKKAARAIILLSEIFPDKEVKREIDPIFGTDLFVTVKFPPDELGTRKCQKLAQAIMDASSMEIAVFADESTELALVFEKILQSSRIWQ